MNNINTHMNRLHKQLTSRSIVAIISVVSILVLPQPTFGTSDGGISECVTSQYGSNGTDTDTHHCSWATEGYGTCSGTCYKYVVSGSPTGCKTCKESLQFWKSCTLVGNTTAIAGSMFTTTCVGNGGGCACDENNWTPTANTVVPCYDANGDGC